MRSVIILDTPTHRVTSYGNGLAYAVDRGAESFFVQGDEASQFHDSVFEQDVFDFTVAIDTLYGDAFEPRRA